MNPYYLRDGTPCTLEEFARRFEDPLEREVWTSELADGVMVSTIWLGINHSFGDGPPRLFETAVFHGMKQIRANLARRYSTEAEARAGHAAVVAALTGEAP